jgi:hypothetical protein
MTYGVMVNVTAPVEMYDALHREVVRSTHAAVEGLLLHIGRSTSDGFQVIEVWTDKDQFDRYSREVVWPAAARLADDQVGAAPQMRTEEFEVRGLVLPAAHLVQ